MSGISTFSRWQVARSFWFRRSIAERSLLLTGAVIIGLVAYGLVLQDAWRELQRLDEANVRIATRLMLLQDGLAEVARHRTNTGKTASPATLVDTLTTSVRSRQLDLTVTPAGPDRMRISGNADFGQAIDWLGNITRDYNLRPIQLRADHDGSPKIDMILAAP
ncbi:MAG: type II secretion system protein M [Proteobacteria bacterium]|nr:type II secretion system protein M [Pseudomonadota bacterium]HQR02579.1 type II secretion system protein GspM [Rhodocyclaceae bacterium]